MISLKLVQFDGSIGLLLPETVLRRLGAAQGDSLCLVETLEGYMLVSRDSERLFRQGKLPVGPLALPAFRKVHRHQ